MAPSVRSLDLSNTSHSYHAPATITSGIDSLVHVSGQVGTTRDGKCPQDYESQIHLALLNLRKILVTAAARPRDIAKLTVYIVNYDPSHRKHTRHIQRFLQGHRPAITLVPVNQLAQPDWLFEIDAVFVRPKAPPSVPRSLEDAVPTQDSDVIIIGAGLSGLSAAHALLQQGLSVRILEARDRVGGKLWSRPISEDGGIVEMGAAWINDVNQIKMIELVRRFGLETIEQNTTGSCILQDFDGTVSDFPYGELPRFDQTTLQDVARIRDQCEADCQALDVFQPQDANLDSLTFDAYLRSKGASETSIATATVWTRAMLGVNPSDISALHFLNYCKSGGGLLQMRSDRKGGGQHLRLRQGTQAIATRLAAALPPKSISLNTPVKSVFMHGSNDIKVVDANDQVYRCRKIITTVPSPALKKIEFFPKLPATKLAWAESASYGYYTKAIAVFKSPFWVDKGLCGLAQSFVGPASVVRDTSSPDDDKHALTCFMVGPPGEQWAALEERERTEILLKQLSTIYSHNVKDDFIELLAYDWSEDAWAGYGCPCPSLAPGVLDTLGPDVIRAQVADVHFAGTETAGHWKGYMEGAVRSGERAAEEVIRDLKSRSRSRL